MNSFNLQVLNLFTSMQSHPTPILTVDDVAWVGPIGFDVTFHPDARLAVFVFLGVSCCQCVHRRLLLEAEEVFKDRALCVKKDYILVVVAIHIWDQRPHTDFIKTRSLQVVIAVNKLGADSLYFFNFLKNPCEIKENLVCRESTPWICHL